MRRSIVRVGSVCVIAGASAALSLFLGGMGPRGAQAGSPPAAAEAQEDPTQQKRATPPKKPGKKSKRPFYPGARFLISVEKESGEPFRRVTRDNVTCFYKPPGNPNQPPVEWPMPDGVEPKLVANNKRVVLAFVARKGNEDAAAQDRQQGRQVEIIVSSGTILVTVTDQDPAEDVTVTEDVEETTINPCP